MRVLNADQMREADRVTIEEIGISSLVLMECAGRQVVSAIQQRFSDLAFLRVAVLCGPGNNGGDGFVIARTLLQTGYEASVFLIGPVAAVRGDARVNLDILGRLGQTVVEVTNEQEWDLHFSDIATCDLVVDAMFGTGLRRPLSGLLETVVKDLNTSDLPVVAVDLPSGLSADTADFIGEAVEAELTVTFAAPKLPHMLPPGETHCGEVVIADIGIPHDVVDALEGPRLEVITNGEVLVRLEPRDPDTHKGDYGRVVIVAGSVGKSGAAHLAGIAALRSGAGLVTIATPASVAPIVASMAPEYMTLPLDEQDGSLDAERALEQILVMQTDVIAIGPGLGTGPAQRALVLGLLARSGAPLVLDADALNICAQEPDRLRARDGLEIVITPHPGEMARLTGRSTEDVQQHRVEVARAFAAERGIYVVLKGHRTLVAGPDGRVAINRTGNPGMATGGTGDVLTGVISAWMAQLLDPEAACRAGVYLHGRAGDLASRALGQPALTASDVVTHLGPAWQDTLGIRASGRDDDE
jgi:ADP-dependent NAD(P)H-hydrate dehydratase / NAD(P)H-hydrate epimerase